MRFCIIDDYPLKWDISVIENLSVGGVKFTAPSDLQLNDKIVHLQIKLQELAPVRLELQAKVLSVEPRFDGSICSVVRAEFINLSDTDIDHLSIVEKMIAQQKKK